MFGTFLLFFKKKCLSVCVGGCEKEDGAVGKRKRKGEGGAEGGRYIGYCSCPDLFDMYCTSKL